MSTMTTQLVGGPHMGYAWAAPTTSRAMPVCRMGSAWSKNKYFLFKYSHGKQAGVAREVPGPRLSSACSKNMYFLSHISKGSQVGEAPEAPCPFAHHPGGACLPPALFLPWTSMTIFQPYFPRFSLPSKNTIGVRLGGTQPRHVRRLWAVCTLPAHLPSGSQIICRLCHR